MSVASSIPVTISCSLRAGQATKYWPVFMILWWIVVWMVFLAHVWVIQFHSCRKMRPRSMGYDCTSNYPWLIDTWHLAHHRCHPGSIDCQSGNTYCCRCPSGFTYDDVTLVEECHVEVFTVLDVTGLYLNFAVFGLVMVDVEHGRWKERTREWIP